MSDARTYTAPRGQADLEAYARALALSFAGEIEDTRIWLGKAGHENIRLLADGSGALLAGLLFVPMGQFFGGVSAPMLGIAGVAVPPEHRAKGAALDIMTRAMRECHERAVPISTLYPAVQSLYRAVGFEQAGIYAETKVNPKLIAVRERDDSVSVRPATDVDDGAIVALYTSVARDADGALDRGGYIWHRIKNPRDGAIAYGYVVAPAAGAGPLEGYFYYSQKRNDTGRHEVTITDVAFTTPRAGRRILSFLAGLRSLCESITWHAAPGDPLLLLMPEHPYAVRIREHWMLRVTDAPRALAARGYAPALRAALRIDLTDELIPANSGRWALRVEEGRGVVERDRSAGPATPRIALGPRGLAALYAGYLSAHALRDADFLTGDDAACLLASALFAPARTRRGVAPSMTDFF